MSYFRVTSDGLGCFLLIIQNSLGISLVVYGGCEGMCRSLHLHRKPISNTFPFQVFRMQVTPDQRRPFRPKRPLPSLQADISIRGLDRERKMHAQPMERSVQLQYFKNPIHFSVKPIGIVLMQQISNAVAVARLHAHKWPHSRHLEPQLLSSVTHSRPHCAFAAINSLRFRGLCAAT